MRLAWVDPLLERRCRSGSQLRVAAGSRHRDAEDLLHLVAQAPHLAHLITFRSLHVDIDGDDLTLSIEEIEMRTHPLTDRGALRPVTKNQTAADHYDVGALLVRDFRVDGRSILRRAS